MALGFAAPASTALIAQRAGDARGFVLALSESANNLALLAVLSVAAFTLQTTGPIAAGMVLAGGLATGTALLFLDILVQKRAVNRGNGSCERVYSR